jgi:hypothetical protein
VQVPGLRGDIVANLTAAAAPGPGDLVLASYARALYGSCAHPTGPANSHGIELPIGKMAVSTNAGRTWRATTLPGCVLPRSLSFLNAKVGFAVVVGGHSNPLRPALYVTKDGARTWRLIAPMPFSGPIDFTSGDDGFAVAANFIEPEALDSGVTGALYRTRTVVEAGSPSRSALRAPPRNHRGVPDAALLRRSDGVVAAVAVNHRTGRDSLVVYSTTEGGRRWSRHRLPSDMRLRSYVAQREAVPFSALSPSDMFTLIAGRLYATTDGARTWSALTPEQPLPGFASLDFASSTYGWVIAANAFDYTTNGGRSWHPLAKQ